MYSLFFLYLSEQIYKIMKIKTTIDKFFTGCQCIRSRRPSE